MEQAKEHMEKAIATILNFTPAEVASIQVRYRIRYLFCLRMQLCVTNAFYLLMAFVGKTKTAGTARMVLVASTGISRVHDCCNGCNFHILDLPDPEAAVKVVPWSSVVSAFMLMEEAYVLLPSGS